MRSVARKQEQGWLDEEVGPIYKGQPVVFGEMINTPIFTTTPTGTITTLRNIQLDHIGVVVSYKYDTLEEALRNRKSLQCGEWGRRGSTVQKSY
jgi:hypothetical protein